MEKPLVSVIMPNWNGEKFIIDSIQSVLKQTYQNFELLIIDDCSSDSSPKMIQELEKTDSRIRYFSTSHNVGPAGARNLGIQNSKGKYIAFLDGDDLWLDDKLEKQITFMSQNHYDFTYTEYKTIAEDGTPTGKTITGPSMITRRKMLHYCYPGCLTVIYKKSIFPNLEIPTDLRSRNDYAMWIQLSQKANCYLLKTPLALYRIRQGSTSHSGLVKLVKSQYKMWRYSGYGKIRAMYHVLCNMFFGTLKKVVYKKKN